MIFVGVKLKVEMLQSSTERQDPYRQDVQVNPLVIQPHCKINWLKRHRKHNMPFDAYIRELRTLLEQTPQLCLARFCRIVNVTFHAGFHAFRCTKNPWQVSRQRYGQCVDDR